MRRRHAVARRTGARGGHWQRDATNAAAVAIVIHVVTSIGSAGVATIGDNVMILLVLLFGNVMNMSQNTWWSRKDAILLTLDRVWWRRQHPTIIIIVSAGV